jgi:HAMP domain-containing protein
MKLRTKIFSVFGLALALNLVFIWFGLSYVLDLVSNRLMENQAKTLTLFIQHQIIAGFAEYPDSPMGPRIDRYLEEAKHVSDESREFAIVKILLITPSLHVENAWPGSEAGQDYSSHEDIRQTMENHRMIVATETFPGPAGQRTDIDVVAWFQLPPGPDGLPRPRVLEVKLDFAQSRVLLEAQYQVIELAAFILAAALLAGLLASLMWMISRTAVRPVLRVSRALETVASGDLDIQLPERGDDEFALLARRFNQMTVGLRERLHLTRYVSRGTVQAVRQAVSAGDGQRPAYRHRHPFRHGRPGRCRLGQPAGLHGHRRHRQYRRPPAGRVAWRADPGIRGGRPPDGQPARTSGGFPWHPHPERQGHPPEKLPHHLERSGARSAIM